MFLHLQTCWLVKLDKINDWRIEIRCLPCCIGGLIIFTLLGFVALRKVLGVVFGKLHRGVKSITIKNTPICTPLRRTAVNQLIQFVYETAGVSLHDTACKCAMGCRGELQNYQMQQITRPGWSYQDIPESIHRRSPT